MNDKQFQNENTGTNGISEEAIRIAGELLAHSRELETSLDRREARSMSKLVDDEKAKELTFHLTDRLFRSPSHKRSAITYRRLVAQYGVPSSFSTVEQVLIRAGAVASNIAPRMVIPAISAYLQKKSSRVILPADPTEREQQLQEFKKHGALINLNILGEAVLSEQEAQDRLEKNMAAIESESCDYLSVKLSSVFSQIHLVAYEQTVAQAADRLRTIYRAALAQSPVCFINLDMEEYRDLQLTVDVFRKVLREPEFLNLYAGIVIQAYLPDSLPLFKELGTWAQERIAEGGAPIKVRLVKGANLAMETAEAEIHDWPLATYPNKELVDANYKAIMHLACETGIIKAVHLGIASHNLFDIAYAMVLREQYELEDCLSFEMLAGMAAPQALAVLDRIASLRLYAPVVDDSDFEAAIAYLIRRLDENTTPGNFLKDQFCIEPGNFAWERQCQSFQSSVEKISTCPSGPRRLQDRIHESHVMQTAGFSNVPDTDFSLPQNRTWISNVLTSTSAEPAPTEEPSHEDVEQALHDASHSTWNDTPLNERSNLLLKCAITLADARGDLIRIMNRECKKAALEADVEISEAIDFANYYGHAFRGPEWDDGLAADPIGPVVIAPPWNFPCAIPCGGILAALIGGNPVILKPAPEAIQTARKMVECLWEAGIPRDALQFVAAPDDERGKKFITDPRVQAIILTGSSITAAMFRSWRPDLNLLAETSGKNVLVITSAADQDMAIKDLVKAAFHHAGQKCSAASVALIERTLLENEHFLSRLKEAAASLVVGSAHNPESIVTPMIQSPSPDLLRGLTQLDPGEEWLLQPTQPDPEDPCLWSPGIRNGVQPGSWIHQTELFGPVLSLIPFDDLDEALAIQNGSAFGLTGGIHSLDPIEIDHWLNKVEVGNAYINRSITGAIVQRQPFGGWKQSSVGPGAKAGGPNYCAQFVHLRESRLPSFSATLTSEVEAYIQQARDLIPEGQVARLTAAAHNAAYWWTQHFSQEHDPSNLAAESNVFRYRRAPQATLIISDELSLEDALITTAMALTANVPLAWHKPTGEFETAAKALGLSISDELPTHPLAVLRTPQTPVAESSLRQSTQPVSAHARQEMLCYVLEQSISKTCHRQGRLIEEPHKK